MKILLFVIIVIAVGFCRCSLLKPKDEVQEFIPGTYGRFSKHEFGAEHDTLVITIQNQSANEYRIVRKWKYERLLDGKKIKPEYKKITTSGIYNCTHQLLQEKETGDFYSFDVKKKLLFNGPTKYQKL